MFETAQERIQLLKAGITGNQIEELYILYNNFTVVGNQIPVEKLEITREIIPQENYNNYNIDYLDA
jgi:hypothetical protein